MNRALACFVIAACGGGKSGSGDAGPDVAVDGSACVRQPAAADRVRHVVISHPYDAAGAKANTWEVLDLSATGELSRPGHMFSMGRADVGEVAFTPDGAIGLVAQEDGSVGIFKLDDAGVPSVLQAGFKGSFYASRVVVAPSGGIYVLDTQWRDNGGGIYELAVDCNDTVTDRGLVTAAKLPAQVAFTAEGKWLVAATDIGSSAAGMDAHLLAPDRTLLASADAFADDMQIVGGATLLHDGSAFLIGDTSQFGTSPNRIAVVPVEPAKLGATVTIIPNIEDPITLLSSPFADKVLAISGFGDAMFQLVRTSGTWSSAELAYQGAKPQLPSGGVMIDAGMLRGLALVAENLGVRKVEMYANGNIVDRGAYSLGSGLVNTTGAIGVTP